MSMTHAGEGWTGGSNRFQFWGNRSRISWGAVLAGAIVAAATSLLLNLLGAAFGSGPLAAVSSAAGEATRTGWGLWEVVLLALSMAAGGYVASRLSGTHSHVDGELHGVTVWAVAILIGLVGFARLFFGGIEVAPNITSSAAPTAASALGTANPERLIDRFAGSLGSSGDPTTMSHQEITAEIRDLTARSMLPNSTFSDNERNRLISLVGAQYGITRDEAAQRVGRMEQEVKGRLAQAEQSARDEADRASRGAVTAARALFPALALGLLGALVGAWIGTRHKRILHPHEHAYEHAYHEHAYQEHLHQPTSVAVYHDDAGRMVSQYLHGVSFPVTKYDLLRFARASNAGPGLLHSIEGMADRTYVNANDVIGALGVVH